MRRRADGEGCRCGYSNFDNSGDTVMPHAESPQAVVDSIHFRSTVKAKRDEMEVNKGRLAFNHRVGCLSYLSEFRNFILDRARPAWIAEGWNIWNRSSNRRSS